MPSFILHPAQQAPPVTSVAGCSLHLTGGVPLFTVGQLQADRIKVVFGHAAVDGTGAILLATQPLHLLRLRQPHRIQRQDRRQAVCGRDSPRLSPSAIAPIAGQAAEGGLPLIANLPILRCL